MQLWPIKFKFIYVRKLNDVIKQEGSRNTWSMSDRNDSLQQLLFFTGAISSRHISNSCPSSIGSHRGGSNT